VCYVLSNVSSCTLLGSVDTLPRRVIVRHLLRNGIKLSTLQYVLFVFKFDLIILYTVVLGLCNIFNKSICIYVTLMYNIINISKYMLHNNMQQNPDSHIDFIYKTLCSINYIQSPQRRRAFCHPRFQTRRMRCQRSSDRCN